MELMEKVAYLKGLMDGLELDTTTKEGKILVAIADVLKEMSDTIYDISDEVTETVELVEAIDEDLGDLEEDFYGDDDCDCCCCDDDCDCDCDCDCCDDDDEDDDYEDEDEDMYECTCPTCGDTICLCQSIIDDGSIDCPGCGEKLEFDFSDIEEEEETEE
ncbi:MAG: hypothetical protein IJC65_06590 [Oscillospiraceae bacterium]|nr:hypothetical protein [Oscillospiraceae bacterium]